MDKLCVKCKQQREDMVECIYGYNQETGYNMRSNYHCERFAKLKKRQDRKLLNEIKRSK